MISQVIAKLFSLFLHPLILPTYAFAIVHFSNHYLFGAYTLEIKLFSLLKIFLLTFFFPVFSITLMVLLRFVETAELKDRQERILPYVATGFFYIWAFVVYQRTNELPFLQAIILGATISVFLSLIITVTSFKISAHGVGMGGFLAVVILWMTYAEYNMLWLLISTILATGLVGSSRLILKAHTPKEVFSGYLAGFFCQWVAFTIIL